MKTLTAILFVALPKLMAGGGQFLLNILLIRSFQPAQFGALSVCMTAILLFDSFLGSAVDMAILRLAPALAASGRHDQSLRVQNAGLLLKPLAVSVLAMPVIFFSAQLSAVLFQRSEFAYLIRLTLLSLPAILLLRSVQTYFQVAQRFGWYGGADLAHNSLRFGLVAWAARAGFATPGLVLAIYAAIPFLVALMLLSGPARELVVSLTNWAALRELTALLRWFVPAAAVGGVTTRMDVFFVAHAAGVGQAGIFTAAQAVALPVLLVGTYLSVVFCPRIMPQLRNGTFLAFYRKFQLSIGTLAVLSFALLLGLWTWIPAALFPRQFQGSWAVLIVLFPTFLSGLVAFPLTISLLLFLKPRFLFLFDASAIPVLCVAYYFVGRKFGALGTAAVTTAYAVMKLGILQFYAWQLVVRQNRDPNCGLQRPLQLLEEF